MGKICIEVCLISARGLRGSSFLWNTQWYAVGWIDPKEKYCTKINSTVNPVWNTKFATVINISEASFNDLALQVEVYSRDPIFLREKLQGTACIVLKEFLAKHRNRNESTRATGEEKGSYQLRKRKSSKPRGFIDVSVRISDEAEMPSYFPGNGGGLMLMDNDNRITLASEDALVRSYPSPDEGASQLPLSMQRRDHNKLQAEHKYTHPTPFPSNHSFPPLGGPSYPQATGPSYRRPRTPALPTLPFNVAKYRPTANYLPGPDYTSSSYINMPSSGVTGPRGGGGGGFGLGLGAGALAAGGAYVYGDDIVTGLNDVFSGFQDPSLTFTLDPPF